MALSTKKLPVAVSLPSGRSRRNDFLVPSLSPDGEAQLVGIRTGKPAAYGMMVYTGVAVSAADLLERARTSVSLPSARGEALALLDRYIGALQALRVGNVLRIESTTDGGFQLVKVQERPPSPEPNPKLPG